MTSTPTLLSRIRTWLRSDMKILRWVFLTLYIALLVCLALPFIRKGFDEWFWVIIAAVMLISQGLFIFGSGTIQLCHPIRRRRLWMPVFVAASMLTLLLTALMAALSELFDDSLSKLFSGMNGNIVFTAFCMLLICNWLFWGVLLWTYAKRWQRMKTLSRLTGLIFAGSLAELLACVPSHIIVSKRPGCLVGLMTMMGICAGIYVMIFSFGPGIVLLFLRPRYRREQMEAVPVCVQCSYDLRGSLAAGSTACPECGIAIPEAVRV